MPKPANAILHALAILLLSGWVVPSGATTPNWQTSVIGGFHAPEDLEVLSTGDLLVAEYGGITGARRGTIKWMSTQSRETKLLYPVDGADGGPVAGEAWGDPSCTEPIGATLAPHGFHLDLGNGPGGKDRLLVVNHAKRESIEVFEIRGVDTDAPSVIWRGCVVTPDDVWLNDVAGYPGGGFVASNMTKRGTTVMSLLENTDTAEQNGQVLDWTHEGGWRRIPGTNSLFVNGLTISQDGGTVYANHYLDDKVMAYERIGGKTLWSTAVDGPDNPSWTPDGKLLIASHREDLASVLECHEKHEAFCGLAYGVVEIDPATGELTEIHHGEGAPFGGATVAVRAGDTIYLGCFTGERMGVLTPAP